MKNRYPTQKALTAVLRMKSTQRAAATSKPRAAAGSKRRGTSAESFPICYHHFL